MGVGLVFRGFESGGGGGRGGPELDVGIGGRAFGGGRF